MGGVMYTGRNLKYRKPLSEINVVPYIDVMLVLLVIFMVTTPLLTQGVQVDLPKANARSLSSQEQEPIIVSVDKTGNYYLNLSQTPSQAISPVILANRVAAEMALQKEKNAPARPVLVKGDSGVSYGQVVSVMALLQTAGAEKIGLITEPPRSSKS